MVRWVIYDTAAVVRMTDMARIEVVVHEIVLPAVFDRESTLSRDRYGPRQSSTVGTMVASKSNDDDRTMAFQAPNCGHGRRTRDRIPSGQQTRGETPHKHHPIVLWNDPTLNKRCWKGLLDGPTPFSLCQVVVVLLWHDGGWKGR